MPFVSWMSSSLLSIFQLNIEVTHTLILTGAGDFVALWVLSSVFSAIDSVPLVRSYDIDNVISTSL